MRGNTDAAKLRNVVLPGQPGTVWDLEVEHGRICSVERRSMVEPGAPPSLLLPALCHPHVHLDKAYILTCGADGRYGDLAPQSGSFTEALATTSEAKQRYTPQDLYSRGSQLLARSYHQGVTALRAFVELDHVASLLALEAAIRLKQDFDHLLHVQICVFAQDPIFSTPHAETNRSIITSALARYARYVDALGTTPYVEASRDSSLRNIEWAITTALSHGLHLDFHLDYNLDTSTRPLAWSVVDLLSKHGWPKANQTSKTIALGHCTQLTTLSRHDLQSLATEVLASELPIHFVGLPTSDLFMMGRPNESSPSPHSRLRATLQVPSIIKDLGLSACIGVNNMGNAFTPYGSGDPLQLASWGVGIYQAGAVDDARLLYGCISWRARKAIGLETSTAPEDDLHLGQTWKSMMLVRNQATRAIPAATPDAVLEIPCRQALNYQDVVWDPPELCYRSVV